MSIAEAATFFHADLESRAIRPSTLKKYRQLTDRLKVWSEERGIPLLAQWNVPAARDFRASWSVAAVTSNKMLERLRAFFRFCVEAHWIGANPAANVRRAKETHRPTLPFTSDELVSIMRVLNEHCAGKVGIRREQAERLRALVLVMRWSGIRISDAVNLQRSQIQGDVLFLRQAKTDVPVRVPLPPECMEALEAFPSGEYFFAPGAGQHETRTGNWRRRLRWLFEKAGVENGHAHRLRDTRAVELLEAGVPMERVSVLLGHDSIRTTEKHYAPWVKSRADQLESDVRKTWSGTKSGQSEPRASATEYGINDLGMVSRAGLGLPKASEPS